MLCEQLLLWLKCHKAELINSLQFGAFHYNSVRKVEIPKGNGKKCIWGIFTVVDQLMQQATKQVEVVSKCTAP